MFCQLCFSVVFVEMTREVLCISRALVSSHQTALLLINCPTVLTGLTGPFGQSPVGHRNFVTLCHTLYST
ncbi:putative pre-16S rRNA nuclease [Trichinella pseudospiralis]